MMICSCLFVTFVSVYFYLQAQGEYHSLNPEVFDVTGVLDSLSWSGCFLYVALALLAGWLPDLSHGPSLREHHETRAVTAMNANFGRGNGVSGRDGARSLVVHSSVGWFS